MTARQDFASSSISRHARIDTPPAPALRERDKRVRSHAGATLVASLALGLCFISSTRLESQPARPRSGVAFDEVLTPASMTPGQRYYSQLTLRNTGQSPWAPETFRLSYHWVTAEGTEVVRDGLRSGFGTTVLPGESIAICAFVEAPAAAGTLELQWDAFQEGVGWFSTVDQDNQYAERIRITDDSSGQPRFDPRAFARLITFLLVTGGHFLVMAMVLRRHTAAWGLTSLDDWLFCTITIGFGTLLAVLHTLAATIGISFASGVALIISLDIILLWWVRGRGGAQRSSPPHSDAAVPDPSFQVPILALPGLVLVTALLLQWYAVTSVSLRITGIDAAHYHVPHALNFAHGTTLFGFLATPHVYPMTTSVWAAWVLQPLSGPLLLDLVTLPGLLVLLASFGLLCRLATGAPGIVWAPWLVLLMLTAPIVRLSLQPSADLFYAAAFVAVFTWCFRIGRNGVVRTPDLLGLALMSGWLVGTKVTGVLSMVATLAVYGALFIARRYIFSRPPIAWRVSRTAAGLGMTAFIGAGGIWLIRNWVTFESPLAPSGLVVAGWTIFPGEGYLAGGYYHSVLADLRDTNYDLAARFATYSKRLIGGWLLPAGLALFLPLVDLIVQWRRRTPSSELPMAKLILLASFVLLLVAHVLALIPAPWTSLEWTRGLALRYLLPLLLLYIALVWISAFPSWLLASRESPMIAAGLSLCVMVGITLYYVDRSATRELPRAEWFPVLDWGWVGCAAAIVVACWARPTRHRLWHWTAAIAVATVVLSNTSMHIARDHSALMARAQQAEPSGACTGELPVSENRVPLRIRSNTGVRTSARPRF